MSTNSDQNGDDEEINRREVAWRVFAAEFDDANYSYAESDEERAPNYVITPTGARANRMFVVGVLTEVEHVNDDVVRARVVDPTGAFVIYAGQYQPDALAFLEDVATPSFVAVTGKARTFQPEDADVVYTSIRPESISEVDVDTRDAWVVQTARQTLKRVATFDDAIDRIERGEELTEVLEDSGVPSGLAAGIPLALDHYGTTKTYLSGVRDLAVDAARVIAEEKDEVDPLTVSPSDGENDVAVDVPEQFAAGVSAEPTTETAETEAASEEAEPAPASESTSEVEPAAADAEAETEGTPAPEPEEPITAESETAESETGSEAETGEPVEEIEPNEVEVGSAAEVEETEEVDTDEMYELSEEERREVEENYDVGFSTGSEIPEAGEAGIETPETEAEPGTAEAEAETAEAEAESATAVEAEVEGAAEAAVEAEENEAEAAVEATAAEADEEEAETAAETAASEVNLENAVLDVMTDLDEGNGADRQVLVDEVVSQYGVSEADVEDAIQSALMGGRCYEAGDDQIKPI